MDFEPLDDELSTGLAGEVAATEPQDYRVVYNRVHGRLTELRRRGEPLPGNLVRLERQLMIECVSLSQGR